MIRPSPAPEDTYHALLLEYACGCLGEAHALVVAAHMALSPDARAIVSRYECVGGSLLDHHCAPVAMTADALDCVMARLDRPAGPDAAPPSRPGRKLDMTNYHGVPRCLETYIQSATWSGGGGGIETMRIKTTCTGWTAEMVRLAPGGSAAGYKKPVEITLILKGAIARNDRRYTVGDLIFDRQAAMDFFADERDGAIFIAVRPHPTLLKRLISLFKN